MPSEQLMRKIDFFFKAEDQKLIGSKFMKFDESNLIEELQKLLDNKEDGDEAAFTRAILEKQIEQLSQRIKWQGSSNR